LTSRAIFLEVAPGFISVMEEIDVWRVAQILGETYGFSAVDYCTRRLRELSTAGDFEGCTVWSRILAAVKQMQHVERRSEEATH
jgi:hypothetical protein